MTSEKNPKFQAVYQEILKSIQNGEFLPGDQLPTETEFAERFLVSRNTLRQALMLLIQEGYIANRQGKGTFVLQNIPESLSSLENISDPMTKCCLDKITQIKTSYELSNMDKDFQQRFSLDASKVLIKVRITYSTDSELVGYSDSYIPYDLMSDSKVPLDNIDAIYDFHSYVISRSDFKAKSEIQFMQAPDDCLIQNESKYVIKMSETYRDKSGRIQMLQDLYMDPAKYKLTIYKPYK